MRLRAGRLGLLEVPAGAAIEVLAEHDVGRIVEVGACDAAGAGHRGLDPDGDGRRARWRGRQRRPGPGGRPCGSWSSPRARAIAVVLVGHVTKDGSIAGPKTMEHLVDAVIALEGERYAALRLVRATKNRFGSTDEVGVFEMAGDGPRSRSPTRRARSWPTTPSRPPAASSRRRWRAAGRCSSRSRRSSRRPATARRRARPAGSTRTGSGCSLRCSAGAPASASARTTSTRTLPAGSASASPASTCRWPSPSRRRCAIARSAPRRVAIGEVGLLGELRSVAGLERRLREAARLGSSRRSSRDRRAARPQVEVAGLRIVEVATLRDAVEAASPACRASWRRRPGDARLTARSRPPGRLDAGTIAEEDLIRYIRVLGAALGGPGRARPRRRWATGCSGDADYAGVLLAAWVIAWVDRRVRDPAVPHRSCRPRG